MMRNTAGKIEETRCHRGISPKGIVVQVTTPRAEGHH